MKTYDALIVGFGKAGKTLAGFLARQGAQVALVEASDKMYGGTCINVGCIPSKSLVNSAAQVAAQPELDFAERALRYQAVIQEKRRVTGMLRQKNFDKLNDHPNITVIHGSASFLSRNTLRVETGEGMLTLQAPRIYLNTGAASVPVELPGAAGNQKVYYSDTLMDLDRLPRRLVILGGGYIGLEFASMYANFGSQVLVLQDGESFLKREDRDVADTIRRQLEEQGVSFRLGVTLTGIDPDGTVRFEDRGREETAPADAVLVALGRRPNVQGLNLAAAGVALTSRDGIQVNERLETSQPGIWAAGDVTGGPQFTYVSLDDFRVLKSGIQGGNYTTEKRKNVPYNVFLDTPYARVGMNEEEARRAGLRFRTVRLPTAAIPKAQVLRRTGGMLKALIEEGTGHILGAMLICPEAYEMINLVKLAMDLGADYTVLRDQVFTHPTMSEALNDLFAL